MKSILLPFISLFAVLALFLGSAQAEGKIKYVTTKAELQKELKSKKVILVDFYADWCGPCRQLEPNLEKLVKTHSEKVQVVKVNVDKARELAKEYNIRSIPAMFTLKDGKVVNQAFGYKSYEQLLDFISGKVEAPKKSCCPGH
jgi:thioredoxin 1